MTDRRIFARDFQRPPSVDFSRPSTSLDDLSAQRARLQMAVEDMESGLKDIRRYTNEGRWNAECAIVWATALIMADGLKEGIASMDRRAKILFSAQDRAIERAEKVMKFFGGRGIAKREDALSSVDDSLKSAANLIEDIKRSQDVLKRVGIYAPKAADKPIRIVLMLTSDAILVADGFKEREKVLNRGAAQEAQIRQRINLFKRKIQQLDQEYSRLVLEAEAYGRTA